MNDTKHQQQPKSSSSQMHHPNPPNPNPSQQQSQPQPQPQTTPEILFEDISYEIYPDRAPGAKQANSTQRWMENFINLRCRSKVAAVMRESSLVKLLLSALQSRGCPFEVDRHLSCENCTEQVTGGYDTLHNQIVVCQNRVYTKSMTQGVLSHELIHMFDYCRAKMDFTNLEHIACSEIRAANLVHCSMISSALIGTTGLGRVARSHATCVRSKAIASIMAVRKNFPMQEAINLVDRVFDRCYADLEPIGRRLRLNSSHMDWAYRERFHYDYDSF